MSGGLGGWRGKGSLHAAGSSTRDVQGALAQRVVVTGSNGQGLPGWKAGRRDVLKQPSRCGRVGRGVGEARGAGVSGSGGGWGGYIMEELTVIVVVVMMWMGLRDGDAGACIGGMTRYRVRTELGAGADGRKVQGLKVASSVDWR